MLVDAVSENKCLVSVILPTYNRCQIVKQSINSVLKQTYSNLELIVVNDGSSDGTSELLKLLQIRDSRLRIIENYPNIGLPSSRNKGVLASHGSMIFFSEDDLVLDENCISILVNSFFYLNELNQNVGAIGPRLINVPFKANSQQQVVVINPLTKDIRVNFELDKSQPERVMFLHSCSLILRSALVSVGGYERRLYKGSFSREESDFYFRLRNRGFHLFYEPKAITFHHFGGLGGCILSSKLKGEYYNVRNHLFYLLRFYGLSTGLFFPSFLLTYLFEKFKGS
jgi:glycosyltransferase involved in cell wall biosynthesis